jgi:Lecithin retinol acyltransferase
MNFRLGDKIWVIGAYNFAHYGIVVDQGRYGLEVVHNDKTSGKVCKVSLQEFARGLPIYISPRNARTRYEQETIARRALTLIGTKYDLWTFNCEDAANYAERGIPISPSREKIVGGFLLIGAVWLWSR